MRHTLRYCFVLLALATTGLFAQAATAPVESTKTGTTQIASAKGKHRKHAKKGHKKHKRHLHKHRAAR